jgi:hypothetical protein
MNENKGNLRASHFNLGAEKDSNQYSTTHNRTYVAHLNG